MNTQGPTEGELIAGQTRVEVTHRSGDKMEVVSVHLLNVREIGRYIQNEGDEAAVAEIFARKKPGWADGLTNESVYRIVSVGERINANPFAEHLRQTKERRARVDSIINPAPNPSPAGSPESATGPG